MLGITHTLSLTLDEMRCTNAVMQAFSDTDCADCESVRKKIAKAIKEATE